MNKQSIILALVIGTMVGILVLNPLWISIHAFDGLHNNSDSFVDIVIMAYKQTLTTDDLWHKTLFVFVGILLSFFYLMLDTRNTKKKNTR
ncbi:MAG TPA: hypothetical protein PKL31_15070 [Fulvivirga sp.]|nr:hypothetical protein [Fulvivirga sp.]